MPNLTPSAPAPAGDYPGPDHDLWDHERFCAATEEERAVASKVDWMVRDTSALTVGDLRDMLRWMERTLAAEGGRCWAPPFSAHVRRERRVGPSGRLRTRYVAQVACRRGHGDGRYSGDVTSIVEAGDRATRHEASRLASSAHARAASAWVRAQLAAAEARP
jgi:hypothetical protein